LDDETVDTAARDAELQDEREAKADLPGVDAAQELAELRAALTERDEEIGRRGESERALVERLRQALAATDPALRVTMLPGTSLAELEASYAAALEMAAGVREAVAREQAAAVPAGAPGRTSAGTPMTAFEKIRAGMGRLG
jgi:murein DD-endopeptidase MepM/ murein hydrolase activator NlpD